MKIYNTDSVKKIINEDALQWKELETKPELFQYNHYMRFLEIINVDYNLFINNDNYKIKHIENKEINELIFNIENNIDKISQVYFVKLFSQKYPIRQYEEPYEYTCKVNRHYIPIIVDSGSQFCIEDKFFIPSAGEDIILDPDSLYSIYNNGNHDAVYLVVDVIKD